MTIQDLGALGELLGSVAVLATLIYLALQTRQNTMAIGAQLDAASIAANQSIGFIGDKLAELIAKDNTLDMTADDVQLGYYWASALSTYRWRFHQVRRGLLPTFNETEMAAMTRGLFTIYPGFRNHWD